MLIAVLCLQQFLFQVLGVKDFAPSNAVVKYLSEYVCDTEAKFLCEDILFLICGTDIQQLNSVSETHRMFRRRWKCHRVKDRFAT